MDKLIWGILGTTVFGWLLGILTSPIVSRITKYYKRDDLKKAIKAELESLAVSLAALLYTIDSKLGPKNDENFNLVKTTLTKYKDGLFDEKFLKTIDKASYPTYKLFSESRKEPSPTFRLKTLSIPFISSCLQDLWVLNKKTQQKILIIHNFLSRLNEEIHATMHFFDLTFTVTGDNHEIVSKNLDQGYILIMNQIKDILVRTVEVIENELE